MLPWLARKVASEPHRERAEVEEPPRGFEKGYAVGDSADLRRIVALPRRPRPSDETLAQWAAEYKARLGRTDLPCVCESTYHRQCCAELLPTQAWVLHDAETYGGVLGPIGVGQGKTLVDLLVSMVATPKRGAMLMLPSSLKRQLLEVDWGYYGTHWKLPNLASGDWRVPGRPLLHVVAYSELSGSKAAELLVKLQPDVIILDEAHSVRNRTTARTKRLFSYLKTSNAKVFAWSGTLTSKSLRDYSSLAKAALGDGSPAPHAWNTTEEWAAALDPVDLPSPPGALSIFADSSGDVLKGYAQRVLETAGVVSSGAGASCQASLTINERVTTLPKVLQDHMKDLEKTWERPDHEEALVDAMSVARCARELSSGFFYRWKWPRKEPQAVIDRWKEARKAWHKELREKLKKSTTLMDSPLLLSRAAIRWYHGYTYIERNDDGSQKAKHEIPKHTRGGPLPVWASTTWTEWHEVKHTAKPETEPVWVDDWLVRDAAAWLEMGPGICWYEFDAFGRAVARADRRFTFAGPGDSGNALVAGLRGDERVIATIRAHGTGKNLQMFSRSLVANPPSDGATWEQLLGRLHRPSQKADIVSYEVYRHTESVRKAVEKARDLSEHIQLLHNTQRLASVASWGF